MGSLRENKLWIFFKYKRNTNSPKAQWRTCTLTIGLHKSRPGLDLALGQVCPPSEQIFVFHFCACPPGRSGYQDAPGICIFFWDAGQHMQHPRMFWCPDLPRGQAVWEWNKDCSPAKDHVFARLQSQFWAPLSLQKNSSGLPDLNYSFPFLLFLIPTTAFITELITAVVLYVVIGYVHIRGIPLKNGCTY